MGCISEVVILVKIGVLSYRVKHYNEESNGRRLEENLDLLEEKMEETKINMVTHKRRIE